jgi:hypothetical protein
MNTEADEFSPSDHSSSRYSALLRLNSEEVLQGCLAQNNSIQQSRILYGTD